MAGTHQLSLTPTKARGYQDVDSLSTLLSNAIGTTSAQRHEGKDPMTTLFRYSLDKRLVAFWGVFGVRPAKDGVTLTGDGRLRATFGFLKLETPLDNVDGAHITRNYRWWTAAARGSAKDDGLTFGTNANAGVCIHFRRRCRRRSDARATHANGHGRGSRRADGGMRR